MIRLQPSAIVLGQSDLKDYEIRRKQHKYMEGEERSIGKETFTFVQPPLTYQKAIHSKPPSALGNHGDGMPNDSDLTELSPDADAEHSTPTDLMEDQNGHLSMGSHSSPENASTIAPPTSPPKNDLRYVGFDDSLTQFINNNTPQPSSPFGITPLSYVSVIPY